MGFLSVGATDRTAHHKPVLQRLSSKATRRATMECHCASAMNGKASAVIKSSKCIESNHSYKEEKDPKKGVDSTELVCMEKAYCTILSELGENTEREGLLRTPLRAA